MSSDTNNVPLPERMRPKSVDDYFGQSHLLGESGVLRKMIKSGNLSSFILWGPPGVGKTTLARLTAMESGREFYTLSAINSGVKDIREILDKAKESKSSLFTMDRPSPVLFIDEIHRFSKSQQDALLAAVEEGLVVLIGATTENPSFEVINPLLSRCHVFVLKPLDEDDLRKIIRKVVESDKILSTKNILIEEDEALIRLSGGDARKLLNILEIVTDVHSDTIYVNDKTVSECVQNEFIRYDKTGDGHYDVISAFIKSIRGSDPNAAVYYLAVMLKGGEDPVFIARRLCIAAAEDIGLANPNALLLAEACFRIVQGIGMPEARIPLAEVTIYLASSPKSNSAYMAIGDALAEVDANGINVPLHLRNAATGLMKNIGYGDGYKYPHDYPSNFVEAEYMPERMTGKVFYFPSGNKSEKALAEYLKKCWPKYYENED